MAKHVIHISEAEALSNFADVLARVRAGAEVVIEKDARAVAIVRTGEVPVLDPDFAADLEEIIKGHQC